MSSRGRRITILFIAAILILTGYLLLRGGPNGGQTSSAKKPIALTDYINDHSMVRMTINGRINSNEMHRVIQISVAQNETTINVFQGYEQNILKAQRYSNNFGSYDNFIHALYLAGFAKTRSNRLPSELGVCPLGFRYVYELFDNNKQLLRTWSATCNGGTYGGNANLTLDLFQRQIPNYGALTNNVQL